MIQKRHEQKFQHFLLKLGVSFLFLFYLNKTKKRFNLIKGNSFIDRLPDPLIRLGDYSLNDFEIYFNSLRKSEKYGRPRMRQHSLNDSNNSQKPNSVINIPQLFLSSQFTLSDTSTFNLVFPGMIPINRQFSPVHFEQQKTRTTSTSSDKSEGNSRRPSTSSTANTNKSTTNGNIRFAYRIFFNKLNFLKIKSIFKYYLMFF